jgi:hypothetical protein
MHIGFLAHNLSLTAPHRRQSTSVRSGDLSGHSVENFLPIALSGKVSFKKE